MYYLLSVYVLFVISVCTSNGASAGVDPLASIVMSNLKAGKGEHCDFDDNGDVEDKKY